MVTEVIMPKLGLTMEEGTIIRWHKQIGERVEIGEVLFELETDKTAMEFESPVAGTLLKILVPEGEAVPVATRVGYIGDSIDEIIEDPDAGQAPDSNGETAVDAVHAYEEPQHTSGAVGVRTSPRVRALARKLGISLESVTGTKENGRISEEDLMAHHAKSAAATEATAAETTCGKDLAKKTPYSGVRRKIGELLLVSCNEKPHIYQCVEVDMQSVIKRRSADKAQAGLPSISDYIVQACAAALKEHPLLNSSLINDEILQHSHINIGYAVDTPRGLMVPVIKHCESLSLEQIAAERKRLVEGALSGKLMPGEYADGTFTISSLGAFGIQTFTSIINPPQTAILSVAAIEDRAVVRNGNIVIRPCMNLTISVDHRVVDGVMAAKTLMLIKDTLEKELHEEAD